MSTSRRAKRLLWVSIIVLPVLLLVSQSASVDPVLEVAIGGETRHFARDALLARPDVASVEISDDVAYGKTMRFRAVPLPHCWPDLAHPPRS